MGCKLNNFICRSKLIYCYALTGCNTSNVITRHIGSCTRNSITYIRCGLRCFCNSIGKVVIRASFTSNSSLRRTSNRTSTKGNSQSRCRRSCLLSNCDTIKSSLDCSYQCATRKVLGNIRNILNDFVIYHNLYNFASGISSNIQCTHLLSLLNSAF